MKKEIPHWKNKSLENLSHEINGVLHTEVWEDVKDCENEYVVSSFGRVKSLQRTYVHPIRGIVEVQERILAQQNLFGYRIVALSVRRVKIKARVHRLVGCAFIPNLENKPQINHKNGIRWDNMKINLEWATNSENGLHSFRELGRKPSRPQLGKSGVLHHRSKKVYCPTLGLVFGSAREAARELGMGQGSISHVCGGRQVHSDGLVFNYMN